MRRVYRHIDDVDLYIGGVSERPVDDSILGPTFLCLIGDQMARLRRGDRLYFEEATAGFTPRKFKSRDIALQCNRKLGSFHRATGRPATSDTGPDHVRQRRRYQEHPAHRFLAVRCRVSLLFFFLFKTTIDQFIYLDFIL